MTETVIPLEWLVSSHIIGPEEWATSRELYYLFASMWREKYPRLEVPSPNKWGRTMTAIGFRRDKKWDDKHQTCHSVRWGIRPDFALPRVPAGKRNGRSTRAEGPACASVRGLVDVHRENCSYCTVTESR